MSENLYGRHYFDRSGWAKDYGVADAPTYLKAYEKDTYGQSKRLLLAPFGHGKTWFASRIESLHRICWNPNIRILVVSKKFDRAKEVVRMVRREIDSNERLRAAFQIEPTENWGDESFTVTRTKNLKEATMTASGLGGQVEGLRLDFIVCDDAIDRDSTFSEVERERAKEWFDSTLLGRLEPNGEALVIGTRWHPNDLYAHIIAKPGWHARTYTAIQADGSALWPEQWPLEKLGAKRAEMGETKFQFHFMNNAVALEGTAFRWEWVTGNQVDRAPAGLRVIIGVDPAATKKELAKIDPDATAIVTVGEAGGHLYLIDIELAYVDANHADLIAGAAGRWQAQEVAVEANAFQKLIVRDIQAKHPRLNVWAEEHYATDKVTRILDLQPRFQSGQIHIIRSCRNLDRFQNEYTSFPLGEHDDILDALEIAVKRATTRYGYAAKASEAMMRWGTTSARRSKPTVTEVIGDE